MVAEAKREGERTKQPKSSHRVRYGEGSFYYRASDQRWVGVIDAGWNEHGRRRRLTVSDKLEDRAWNKFVAKRKDVLINGFTDAGVRSGTTVKAWCDEWLARRARQVKPKTLASERSALNKWIIPRLGNHKIANLNPGHVRGLADAVLATDTAGAATNARYVQRIFQQVMREAKLEGHQVSDRVLMVPKPAPAKSDRDSIPLPDALKILQAARELPHHTRWDMALLQGMRQGECLGLTWEHVDLEAGVIRVEWELQELTRDQSTKEYVVPAKYSSRHLHGRFFLLEPKSGAARRTVPLIPEMVEALRAWREIAPVSKFDLVWPRADGGPVSDKVDRREWRGLQDAAEVPRVGRKYLIHECRHSTVSLLLAAGVQPAIIEAIVGHSKLVKNYVHVDEVQMRAALASIATPLQLSAS